jgi:hypothetical protein
MCSGCSGDYGGEFDDPGEPAANAYEANSPTSAGCGPDEQRSQAKQTRGFEANLSMRADGQLATARGCKDESAAEAWEILVSETQIIEIRTIAASECELKEWAGAEAHEALAAGQHSIAPSAKYYQTRRQRAKKSGDRVEMASSRGIGCLLAAEFSRWMQWARKHLAISRAKNSLRSRELGKGDGITRS